MVSFTNGTTADNITIKDEESYDYMHYFSLTFVILPGFVINSAALFFIIKDIRKAVFPAIILLLVLCSTDLLAVILTAVHVIISLYVTDVTYAICSSKAVLHTFFQLYSGILNAVMSVDRVMAICFPFFYKRSINVSTWKFGTLVAAFITALFNFFPIIGLGDVIITVSHGGKTVRYCSTFTYWPEPQKRVYGTLYGIFGIAILLTIVTGNSMVIRSVFKMRTRIASPNVDPSSSTESNGSGVSSVTSADVAFAKLMGGLALVYVTCGTPYNTLILLQQIPVRVNPSVKGIFHFLAGLSYSVDPIVYILIRKTRRKRLLMLLCCRCKNDEQL